MLQAPLGSVFSRSSKPTVHSHKNTPGNDMGFLGQVCRGTSLWDRMEWEGKGEGNCGQDPNLTYSLRAFTPLPAFRSHLE